MPATIEIGEIMFEVGFGIRGRWSTDEAQAVGEKKSFQRSERRRGSEEIVNAGAADKSLEPRGRV